MSVRTNISCKAGVGTAAQRQLKLDKASAMLFSFTTVEGISTMVSGGRVHVSLAALRTFEAVGRHRSLTAAAAELNVTLSAVSHQVRELERALGTAVTVRQGRGLDLTAAGEALFHELSPSFERIYKAVERTAVRRDHRILNISVLPWFASRWLIPRLGGFQVRHPDADVRISATTTRVDLDREGFDCAIRYGPGNWPGVQADFLMSGAMTALCHRSLIDRLGPPQALADLQRYVPLYSTSGPDDWALWLRAAGSDEPPPAPSFTYDSRELVMQAVLRGIGIGIVERSVLASEVAAGTLVRPFAAEYPTGWHYMFMMSAERRSASPLLGSFRDWLIGEAQADRNLGLSPS